MTTINIAMRMVAPSIQAMSFCSSNVTPSVRDTNAAILKVIRILFGRGGEGRGGEGRGGEGRGGEGRGGEGRGGEGRGGEGREGKGREKR